MKEQEKQLLLKDLCARLPYKVKCYCMLWDKDADGCPLNTKHAGIGELCTIYTDEGSSFPVEFVDDLARYGIDDIRPYLRSMSSMTEEEKKEFIHHASYEIEESVNGRHYEYYLKDYVGTPEEPTCNPDAIDWLNAHHFDYRGLIEKGLALPAKEGMY